MEGQVRYKEPVTINTGKAIVTVYVPDLDAEGERKRQERIKTAAERFFWAVIKAEQETGVRKV